MGNKEDLKEVSDKYLALLKPHYNDAVKYSFALCYKFTKEDAEDLFQQSLLDSFEKFEQLKEESKFKSWFFTIITRKFYELNRKAILKRLIPLHYDQETVSFPEVFRDFENEDNKELVKRSLNILSTKEKSALLLFELSGFSIEEIMEIQKEKTISAVKTRLSRARKKLKDFIEAENTREEALLHYDAGVPDKSILG
ncbi:RNA polymerase sigma factor [soil metagenome]